MGVVPHRLRLLTELSRPDMATELGQVPRKVFRETDFALVVYRESQIVGVKHSAVGPWLVWDPIGARWHKALPDDARAFELLPLSGYVKN